MFTGIVEEIGTIGSVSEVGNGRELQIRAATVLEGTAPGDSISVDGVCLTVTALLPTRFVVQGIATTLERSILGDYRVGRRVNLERAAALGTRLGGHLVQGHVDGVGRVRSVEPRDELTLIEVAVPEEVAATTVLHGSVTLNGISLTVHALPEPDVVQVSIIPFTRDHTNVSDLQVGDPVNLEGDLIGKYVRRLLEAPARATGGQDLRRAWGYQGE